MMDELPDWARKRQAELEAAAPKKRKKKKTKAPPYVQLPVAAAIAACRAMDQPKALVLIYVLHLHFKTKRKTFPVPNVWLQGHCVGRWHKTRALAELAAASLITVEWRQQRSPLVTITDRLLVAHCKLACE